MKDHFKSIGDIVRADIVMLGGRSKGMGTVEFRNKEDVQRAIDEMDHSTFLNREIFVRQDNPPPGGESRAPPSRFDDRRSRFDDRRGGSRFEERRFDDRRSERRPREEGFEIFVGNLPFRTNWQDLKDLFRNVGEVIRADVRQDDRGRSKGFGTVIFSNQEDILKAIEQYDKYELDGRRIDVREGRPSGGQQNSRPQEQARVKKNSDFTEGVTGDNEIASETIFADNLPFATANEDLFDLFETVGKVETLEIKFAPNGRASGSAVIRFSTVDEAATAIEKLNNYEYGNRPLKLSYARYPNQEPSQDAPIEDAPIEDAPVEDAPVEDAQVEEAPVDAPVESAPTETVVEEITVVEELPEAEMNE